MTRKRLSTHLDETTDLKPSPKKSKRQGEKRSASPNSHDDFKRTKSQIVRIDEGSPQSDDDWLYKFPKTVSSQRALPDVLHELSRDESDMMSSTELSPIRTRNHDLAVYQPSYASASRVLGDVGISG